MCGYICGLLGLILVAPVILIGYIKMVEKDQIKELEYLIEALQEKEELNNTELLFLVSAKEHLEKLYAVKDFNEKEKLNKQEKNK